MLYKGPFDRTNVRIRPKRGDWRKAVDLTGPNSMGDTTLNSVIYPPKMYSVSGESDMYESPYKRVKLQGGIDDILSSILSQGGLPTIDLQSIVEELTKFISGAGQTVTAALNSLASTAEQTVNIAADGAESTINSLKTAAETQVSEAFATVLESVSDLGKQTLSSLKEASDAALKEAANLSNTVMTVGDNAFDTISNMANSTVSMLQNTGQQILNEAKTTLVSELGSFKSMLDDKIKAILDEVGKQADAISKSGDSSAGFFQKNKKPVIVGLIILAIVCICLLFFAVYLKHSCGKTTINMPGVIRQ